MYTHIYTFICTFRLVPTYTQKHELTMPNTPHNLTDDTCDKGIERLAEPPLSLKKKKLQGLQFPAA